MVSTQVIAIGTVSAALVLALGLGLGLGLSGGGDDEEILTTTTVENIQTTTFYDDILTTTTAENIQTTTAKPKYEIQEFDWTSDLGPNALDNYVKTEDPNFDYKHLTQFELIGNGYKTFVLNYTSQSWKGWDTRENPLWIHELYINLPINEIGEFDLNSNKNVDPNNSPIHLFVNVGGSWSTFVNDPDNYYPDTSNTFLNLMQQASADLKQPTAFLKQTPFQFDGSGTNKLHATGWGYFLESNGTDTSNLIEFPSVKAIIGALTVIKNFANDILDEDEMISSDRKFSCTGGSKAGQFCYLSAATAPEKFSHIFPLNFDILRTHKQIHNNYQNLNGFSFAWSDYIKYGKIIDYIDTPILDQLCKLIDPWSYRTRFAENQIIIAHNQATGDELMMIGDTHLWLDDMRSHYDQVNGDLYGTSHVFWRYLRNIEHSGIGRIIFNDPVYDSMKHFTLKQNNLPRFRWFRGEEVENIGKLNEKLVHYIIIESSAEPIKLTFFSGETKVNNTDTNSGLPLRDFRLAHLNQDNQIFPQIIFFSPNRIGKDPITEIDSTDEANFPFAYKASLEIPVWNLSEESEDNYYNAFFIEAQFAYGQERNLEHSNLIITSDVSIGPSERVFEDCYREECQNYVLK